MSGELSFDGKVVIVTGAGRAIGRADAVLLAARGAKVVVCDNGSEIDGDKPDPGLADEVVEEIKAAGGEAVAHAGDLTEEETAAAIVATALDTFGGLDALVLSAGLIVHSSFPDTSDEIWDSHLALDPQGSFYLARAAWPHLEKAPAPRVVMSTSSAAFGAPTLVPYASSRAGVLGLARSLAMVGADKGIRVNTVAPYAYSRMTHAAYYIPQSEVEGRAAMAPPELVASVVGYLAHESCETTGQVYVCGAGRVARILTVEVGGFQEAGLTPEAVRDHWTEINGDAAADQFLIENGALYNNWFYEQIPGWGEWQAK